MLGKPSIKNVGNNFPAMMAWFNLVLASIMQVGWVFSLKYLDMKKILHLQWLHLFGANNSSVLWPLAGFIVLGAGNVIFFGMAMKHIPAAIAFALWMGLALIGIKLTDIIFFKDTFSYRELFFFALIIISMFGLKK